MGLSRFKYNPSSWLIILGAAIAAYFLASAAKALWGFYRLDSKVPAAILEWKIVEKSSSQFAIEALYTFELQGKTYKSKTIFGKPYHLNRPSAEKQITRFQTEAWSAWVRSSHPGHSSLYKEFPLKKTFYALMTLGIACYFISLRLRYSPSY